MLKVGNACYINNSLKLWLIIKINDNKIELKAINETITIDKKDIKKIIEN